MIVKAIIFPFKAPVNTITIISSNLLGVGEEHLVFLLFLLGLLSYSFQPPLSGGGGGRLSLSPVPGLF